MPEIPLLGSFQSYKVADASDDALPPQSPFSPRTRSTKTVGVFPKMKRSISPPRLRECRSVPEHRNEDCGLTRGSYRKYSGSNPGISRTPERTTQKQENIVSLYP